MIAFTPRQVCALLAISPTTLRALRRRGKLHGTRLGYRTVRYSAGELARLLGEPVANLPLAMAALALREGRQVSLTPEASA